MQRKTLRQWFQMRAFSNTRASRLSTQWLLAVLLSGALPCLSRICPTSSENKVFLNSFALY